ncbi:MAG: hypothetical protein BWY64_03026 [bacterium ADurb.Bin363]|nr:MAG: hypothetical protein BWY64_03026 [bacterium ADurb.Bin363]
MSVTTITSYKNNSHALTTSFITPSCVFQINVFSPISVKTILYNRSRELYDSINNLSFYIKEFLWDNKRYILKKAVICYSEFKDDLWIYKVPEYGLHTFSENKEEAFNDLHEEFAFLCDDLLDEPDEKLTCRAIKLRDSIKFNLDKIL